MIGRAVGPVVAGPSEWLAVGGPRDRLGRAMRTRTWRDACDTVVNIPIGGAASSLGAPSAGAVALYEIARQRK